MTDGEKRRERIVKLLEESETPVSGTRLAAKLGVSRQIIVQDVALLRAENRHILSTYQGYVLETAVAERGAVRVFRVSHDTKDTLDELQTIVDYGGRVLDVFVEHPLYGQIRADLIIGSRLEAAQFVEQMEASLAQPLKLLTDGHHYHTVTAPSERHLDLIGQELERKGYLLPEA
ncbi:MAG: transcription repressor NadR [Eubacteriales bacterium]|nr:transcription repressor NadR [Eubacteriales bacterium]